VTFESEKMKKTLLRLEKLTELQRCDKITTMFAGKHPAAEVDFSEVWKEP